MSINNIKRITHGLKIHASLNTSYSDGQSKTLTLIETHKSIKI